jgi:type VI secretion system protein ImpG
MVERLLEAFAFLTARVQLKIKEEFPRFTQHLLEMVYPHFLPPLPSMAIVQFQPDMGQGSLIDGFPLPGGGKPDQRVMLRGKLGHADQTPVRYRIAHDVTLWPIEIGGADYFSHLGPIRDRSLPLLRGVKAGVRIRLRCLGGATFDQLGLSDLDLFVRGADATPYRLLELLLAHQVGLVVQTPDSPTGQCRVAEGARLSPIGLDDREALLPTDSRTFQGYRLLQEYFAFPQRFLFFRIRGLAPTLQRIGGREVDLIVPVQRADPDLTSRVDADSFALFCTPAVNLFMHRCRIPVDHGQHEQHIVPDRNRPMDFEIYRVDEVCGFGAKAADETPFLPFYSLDVRTNGHAERYYSLRREPRMSPSRGSAAGTDSEYRGSEVYLDLVDPDEAPYTPDVRQLGVTALCTNRSLPLRMPIGNHDSDFDWETAGPIAAVRCVGRPTPPRSGHAHGDSSWRLVSQLATSYLTLVDTDPEQGAAALRELLGLYADSGDRAMATQVAGLRSVHGEPIVRRLPVKGEVTYGRGLEVTLTVEESAFAGAGAFVLGQVLAQFFARYASVNSFTETVLRSERGEIMRWVPTIGTRQII